MKNILYFSLFAVLLFIACSKKPTPSLLEGKWKISKTYLMDETYDGIGSFLEFSTCDSSLCPGIDYNADDNTTGTFTWSLDKSARILTINDTLEAGGGYNGDWEVVSITNKRLRLKTNVALFGDMTILFKKQ